jgi:hypothetical protein
MQGGCGSTSRIPALPFAGASILLVASLLLVCASGARAAGIVVDSPTDPGGPATECNLRQALASANTDTDDPGDACTPGSGTDTITFDAAALPLVEIGDQLVISSNLYIEGPGVGSLNIDGSGGDRVFHVTSGSSVISGMKISGGLAALGGGLKAESGTVLLLDAVEVSGNQAVASHTGPPNTNALAQGGGIHNLGALTIDRSTISDNTAQATASGGATSNTATAAGGGIYSNHPVDGYVYVKRGTIEGNDIVATATGTGTKNESATGGGIHSQGGGGDISVIAGSTIAGNTATDTQGIGYAFGGGIQGDNSTFLVSDTVTSNSAVNALSANVAGAVTIESSIVADPVGGGQNCFGVQSDGHNLTSDLSCDPSGTGDIAPFAPHLLAIGNWGGPTRTRPPEPTALATVTALDQGVSGSNPTDQRGFPRTVQFDLADGTSSDGSDIGAVEIQAPTITGSTPASAGDAAQPLIFGSEELNTSATQLFNNATCAGPFSTQSPAGFFGAPGLSSVPLGLDSTNNFGARIYYGSALSACSPPFTYIRRPAAPVLDSTEPASGSNGNSPVIKGSALSAGTVTLYKSNDCSGLPAGTGSTGDLGTDGIPLAGGVPDNSSTEITAKTAGVNADSSCSGAITYAEVTPAPVVPPIVPPGNPVPVKPKKCKKPKKKTAAAKKKFKKCKKRLRAK